MTTTPGTPADIARIFAEPPPEYTPVPIWWWSGEPVVLDRLLWQLRRFADGGIFNVLVMNLAPSGPLFGCCADDPPFRSDAWWELFERVCEEASVLGVRLWFYDQLGFSGANLQGLLVDADDANAGWALDSVIVGATADAEGACPPDAVVIATFPTSDPSRLRVVYTTRTSFDYLSPTACAELFDQVHGEFERRLGKYFGSVIVGTFQDELPPLPTWSENFLAEFQARAGHDLLATLPALFEGDDESARRTRVDYQRVRAELVEEAFFKPLFAFHEDHGLVGGCDQYVRDGDPTRTTRFYADYFRTHRWFGAPGSDQTGEGKVHSSIAHLYDRPRTWFEAFYGSGWGGTIEETFDWLIPWLRAGATLYNPHAAYYATTAGWWEWAPPSTCWRQPYWQHYPVLAEAVSRLCAALSQGRHVCDVAVLHPSTSVQADQPPFADSPEPLPLHAASGVYRDLVGWPNWWNPQVGVLDRAQLDYDVVDESSLARATVDGLRLAVADESYAAVVLPGCTAVEAGTADALCDFVAAGGTLVAVGDVPTMVHGDDTGTRLARLLDALDREPARRLAAASDVPAALAHIRPAVFAPVPTLHRRVDEHDLLFVPAAAWSATERAQPVGYTFSTDRYASMMPIRLTGPVAGLEAWDPVTGERRPVAATADGDAYSVDLDFDGSPALLLSWRRAHETAPATPIRTPRRVLAALPGPFDVELEQTLDNRHGDFASPPCDGPPPVQTWSFESARSFVTESAPEPAGPWEATKATFGSHGWWTGPLPAEQLPDPLPALPAETVALAAAGWDPLVYSTSRGIPRDPAHHLVLGPKGTVPEEFLDLGSARSGEGVQLRTVVWHDGGGSLHLAVGANAAKRAWVNGVEVGSEQPGYLWSAPVELRAGANLLELRLVAEEDLLRSEVLVGGGQVRGFWALVTDAEAFDRPEWVQAVDEPVTHGEVVRFETTFTLPVAATSAEIQVASDSRCTVSLDGVELGQQGGFLPYHIRTVQTYAIDALAAGSHTLECAVETSDLGAVALVDAAFLADGEIVLELVSDEQWYAESAAAPRCPVRLRRRPLLDPAFVLRRPRPHPLPATAWLDHRPVDGVVVPAPASAFPHDGAATHLRWTLPPGATSCAVPVGNAAARLWVDDEEVPLTAGAAELPHPARVGRRALLRVEELPGRTGGAMLEGPVTYTIGAGRLELGDWAEQGLDAYSGGVRYRTTVDVAPDDAGEARLELGRVVGTAQVWVNGQDAGVRALSPYRFDIAGGLHAGVNTIEILVLNTLGPFFGAVSPTPYVFPNQLVSGLFGPVTITAPDRTDAQERPHA